MSARPFLLLASGLLLCGCAQRGDFGRPAHNLWNDVIVPTSSYATAALPEDKRSSFNLTDDEKQLRERAYRFTLPPNDRGGLFGLLESADPPAYYRQLAFEWRRSQVSRYRRIQDDATADRQLILPLRAVAARVLSADELRLKAAGLSPHISPDMRHQAELRAGENVAILDELRAQFARRIAAYRYALENLVVEQPSAEAVPAERALLSLEAEMRLLERIPRVPLDCGYCGGRPGNSRAGPNFAREPRETLAPLPVVPLPPPAAPMVTKD